METGQDALDELNLVVLETGQVDVRLLVERSACTKRVLLLRLRLRGRSGRRRRGRGRRINQHLRRGSDSFFLSVLLDLLGLRLALGSTRRRCPLALLSGGSGRDLLLVFGSSSSTFGGGGRRRRRRRCRGGRNLLVGLLDQDANEEGSRVLQMRVQPQAVFEAEFLLVADRPQSLAPRLARAAAALGIVVGSVAALPRVLALVLALAALVVVLLDGNHLLSRRWFRRIFGGGFGCIGVRSRVQVVVEHLPRCHTRSSNQARQLVGNRENRHFCGRRVTT